mmetsp:Transcript_1649/g.1456  ORF Transcript_1649/g.1456 Transcript_1649/m.1456 type:complete len:164 (-) Transcript_1649:315-806(-)
MENLREERKYEEIYIQEKEDKLLLLLTESNYINAHGECFLREDQKRRDIEFDLEGDKKLIKNAEKIGCWKLKKIDDVKVNFYEKDKKLLAKNLPVLFSMEYKRAEFSGEDDEQINFNSFVPNIFKTMYKVVRSIEIKHFKINKKNFQSIITNAKNLETLSFSE